MRVTNDNYEVFESGEISRALGMKLLYLNKFIERGLYGISPSVRVGKGRGRRRLFSRDDVLGIALVWWLFQCGLRARVIEIVLEKLSNRPDADANIAARKVEESGADISLLITREPGIGGRISKQIAVALVEDSDKAKILKSFDSTMAIVIPIGNLFFSLQSEIESRAEQGG
jgi:hypothetical protein